MLRAIQPPMIFQQMAMSPNVHPANWNLDQTKLDPPGPSLPFSWGRNLSPSSSLLVGEITLACAIFFLSH